MDPSSQDSSFSHLVLALLVEAVLECSYMVVFRLWDLVRYMYEPSLYLESTLYGPWYFSAYLQSGVSTRAMT